jgi:hypothetical protein
MIIHLYTITYNEEKILPFFFKHYEKFVDRFFFYDNESTDGTLKILKTRKDVTVRTFKTNRKQNTLILTKLRNSIWKNSIGKCDYVIVCDADEFLYHKNLKNFLGTTKNKNVTIYKPYGFEMFSETFPHENLEIIKQIKLGIEAPLMSKCVIFNPNMIIKTNYSHGSHSCMPEGYVKICRNKGLKLLHYKQLCLEYFLRKKNIAKKRVPKKIFKMGLSTHYFKDDSVIISGFNNSLKKAKFVI